MVLPGLLLLAITGLAIGYMNVDVLEDTGVGTFIDPDGRVAYTIHLDNTGFANVTLLDAWVNDGDQPEVLQLGASFNSGHLVQAGIDDPAIVFMDLGALPIRPKLSPEALQEAIRNKDEKIPTLYGLHVVYQGQVESVTIKYKYLGMVKTKRIVNWFGQVCTGASKSGYHANQPQNAENRTALCCPVFLHQSLSPRPFEYADHQT